MNGEVVLSCENLSIGYRSPVMTGITLDVRAGQFVSLLGPNGVGKTTLLRTLSRHLKPLAGRVAILGRDLQAVSALDLARTMAVCLTDNARPPLLTVFEFAALGRYPHTGFMGRLSVRDRQVVAEALDAVAAGFLADRYVDRLSDGERQKAVVARALAQEPKILLLDEPTAHLDLKHRVEVMGILRNLCRSRGVAVLASLHDVDIAAKVSDRVVLVKAGRVVANGLPEGVLTSEAVSDLYDFDAANFSRDLGGIEIKGDGRAGCAFVAAGQGRGAVIYRLLAKRGMEIRTGVLTEGDLDAYVARALGASAIVRPRAPDDGGVSLLPGAIAALSGCDFVVDSAPEAPLNRKIVEVAFARGLPVFTIGAPAGAAGTGRTCASLSDLVSAIDALKA